MNDDVTGPHDHPLRTLTGRRARFSITPGPARALPHIDGLLAGVAEVDLTPPPGLPKGGYSRNAHTATGFRTRIRARVVHVRSGTSSVAIVALDLLAGSSVIQHLVADAIRERTDIDLAGLMIGATHTHAGPGQFLGTDFYNRFASNKVGFDPAWATLLVDRIAAAVIEAHDTRAPAVAAWGTTEVWGLTRNRSLEPHVQNSTVTDTRLDPQRKWVAINPELHLLRVDRIDGADQSPLGALCVFSVHGTGVPQQCDDLNADLWAYTVGELSLGIEQRSGQRCVVGAIEGTHADVAPALRPGLAGHLDAKRVGRGIGAEAAVLWDRLGDQLSETFPLATAFRELDMAGARPTSGARVAPRPAVGAALVAGAKENLTPIISRIPPFAAGRPKPHRAADPQGAKWVIGSRWLQPLAVPPASLPVVLPLQILRIGDRALVGLPFEITVETGRRIAAEMTESAAELGVAKVVVSSVANEYSGYIATAEEYSRQFYEGGHTLYGPNTQRFVAEQVARLASDLVRQHTVSDPVRTRRWNLTIRRYLPTGAPGALERADWEDAVTFVDPTSTEEGFWEATWLDGPPAQLDWQRTMIRVEGGSGAVDPDRPDAATWLSTLRHGRTVDDQLWDIGITHLGAVDRSLPHGTHRYRVRWFDPEHRSGVRHRFVRMRGDDVGPASRAFD